MQIAESGIRKNRKSVVAQRPLKQYYPSAWRQYRLATIFDNSSVGKNGANANRLISHGFEGVRFDKAAKFLPTSNNTDFLRTERFVEHGVVSPYATMRAKRIIIADPDSVNCIEMFEPKADEMVQALSFYLTDEALDERVRHRGGNGCAHYFYALGLPEIIKPIGGVFFVVVAD